MLRPKNKGVGPKLCFMVGCLSAIPRILFHPAKFDYFKDEKISDYKTVLKNVGLGGVTFDLRAAFLCFGGIKRFKICLKGKFLVNSTSVQCRCIKI